MSANLKKSADVMAAMNNAVKLPEINKIVMHMSREMEKMGFIDEMISEGIDAIDGEEVEQEADEEIQKVLDEISKSIPNAVKDALPVEKVALPVQDAKLDRVSALKS